MPVKDPLSDVDAEGYITDRAERIWRKVLRELIGRTFQSPISDQHLARLLNSRYPVKRPDRGSADDEEPDGEVNKAQIREATIFLEGRGLVRRTGEGIIRFKFKGASELHELYALRLEDELASIRHFMSERNREDRMFSINNILAPVVRQQRALLEDKESKLSPIRWVELGIKFHVKLARAAKLHMRSRRLRNCLYRIRIGSDMPVEDYSQRVAETEEHEQVIAKLRSGDTHDLEKWIVDHIRASVARNRLRDDFMLQSDAIDSTWQLIQRYRTCIDRGTKED